MSSPARLTGYGPIPNDIPAIAKLLETSSVTYLRPSSVQIEARRATLEDLPSPLITYVTDRHGDLFIETTKTFSHAEINSGIIILRYPGVISQNGKYNEWYVTKAEWDQKYLGEPQATQVGFASFESRTEVVKNGLDITEKVIELLGGKDGKAEISVSWGGTMWAFEGGLLTKEGTGIAPQILEKFYRKVKREAKENRQS